MAKKKSRSRVRSARPQSVETQASSAPDAAAVDSSPAAAELSHTWVEEVASVLTVRRIFVGLLVFHILAIPVALTYQRHKRLETRAEDAYKAKRWEDAVRYNSSLLARNPQDVSTRLRLVHSLLETDNAGEAEDYLAGLDYETIPKKQKNSRASAYALGAWTMLETNPQSRELIEQAISRALDLAPANPYACLVRGRLLSEEGKVLEASEWFEKIAFSESLAHHVDAFRKAYVEKAIKVADEKLDDVPERAGQKADDS